MINWSNFPARKLPEIDIAGIKFYLDLRLLEFREVDDFSNRFSVDQLIAYPGGGFIIWIDMNTKKIFEGLQEDAATRQLNLRTVRLPALEKMDPVGYRALKGLPPKLISSKRLKKKIVKPNKGQRKGKKL